jgi:hypothetical protein
LEAFSDTNYIWQSTKVSGHASYRPRDGLRSTLPLNLIKFALHLTLRREIVTKDLGSIMEASTAMQRKSANLLVKCLSHPFQRVASGRTATCDVSCAFNKSNAVRREQRERGTIERAGTQPLQSDKKHTNATMLQAPHRSNR